MSNESCKGICDLLHGFEVFGLINSHGRLIVRMSHERGLILVCALGVLEEVGEEVPAGVGDVGCRILLVWQALDLEMRQQRIEDLLAKVFVIDHLAVRAGEDICAGRIDQAPDDRRDLRRERHGAVRAGCRLEAADQILYLSVFTVCILGELQHFVGAVSKIAEAIDVIRKGILSDLPADQLHMLRIKRRARLIAILGEYIFSLRRLLSHKFL